MKAIITTALLLMIFIGGIGQVAESKVGFKSMYWKQLDALVLNNGKLLSWEQHGKESFIRLYKEDLKLETSFRIAEDKRFLKSTTTRLIEFSGHRYIVYDLPVNEGVHQLVAQEVLLEQRTLKKDYKKIAKFETNKLVKGYFTIESKTERRMLVSYHERITYDYNQRIYFNLLDEKFQSVNERTYTFAHKWNLFRKINYLALPNNNVMVYGELYASKVFASDEEIQKKEAVKYKVFNFDVNKAKDTEREFKIDNYFISNLFLKLNDDDIIVAGTYSDYSNIHNKGYFKGIWNLDLSEKEKIKLVEFPEAMCKKVNNAFFSYRDSLIQQTKGASFFLENKIKSKYELTKGGLYAYELIDVEIAKETVNFIMAQNYKLSIKEASLKKVNSTLISDQKNNYIEGNIVYFKTDMNTVKNYQIIERFNVTKSKKYYRKSSVNLARSADGKKYMYYLETGKYMLNRKLADEYTFTTIAKLDYGFYYKKRGDKMYFNSDSEALYSYKKENKRVKIIRVN